MMSITQQIAAGIKRLTVFCIERGAPRCFMGWGPGLVFRYVAFQLMTGGVFVAWKAGQPIMVVFCWPVIEDELKRRVRFEEPVFQWDKPPQNADAFFLAEVIGNRQNAASVARQIMAKGRNRLGKKLFTFRMRNGCSMLRELKWPTVERFICHELT